MSIPPSVCLDLYASIFSYRKWALISDFLDLRKVSKKPKANCSFSHPTSILPCTTLTLGAGTCSYYYGNKGKFNQTAIKKQSTVSSHYTLDQQGQIVPLYKGKFNHTAITKQSKIPRHARPARANCSLGHPTSADRHSPPPLPTLGAGTCSNTVGEFKILSVSDFYI